MLRNTLRRGLPPAGPLALRGSDRLVFGRMSGAVSRTLHAQRAFDLSQRFKERFGGSHSGHFRDPAASHPGLRLGSPDGPSTVDASRARQPILLVDEHNRSWVLGWVNVRTRRCHLKSHAHLSARLILSPRSKGRRPLDFQAYEALLGRIETFMLEHGLLVMTELAPDPGHERAGARRPGPKASYWAGAAGLAVGVVAARWLLGP